MCVPIEHSNHSLNMRLLISSLGFVDSVMLECGQLRVFGELAPHFGIDQ